ncbi:MAG: hypothetical protein K9I85_05180 [Saprospiraceae bacterium]|nr:hypothetical protein [Saprospiraceae bacterium]
MANRTKILLLLLLFNTIAANGLLAQMVVGQDTLYGNEWIDYSKTYWKIKVAKRDMYRVNYDVLAAGGFPVDQVNGDQFQLFVYGKEVPLYVSTDGLFGPDDYFEFYGDKNKSQLDQFLFEGGREEMLNPEVSLYTDTAVYFLCWTEAGQPTKRYLATTGPTMLSTPVVSSYKDTARIDFISWHYSKTYDSDHETRYSIYDEGEGLATSSAKITTIPLSCPGVVSDSIATLVLRLVSSSSAHELTVKVNNVLVLDIPDYPSDKVNSLIIPIPPAVLLDLNLIVIEGIVANSDRYQIASASILYSRTVADLGQSSRFYTLQASNVDQNMIWSANEELLGYDLIQLKRFILPNDNGLNTLTIAASPEPSQYCIRRLSSMPSTISVIELLQFVNTDLSQGNYVIITHPSMTSGPGGIHPIQEYADYRSSLQGGGYSVEVIMIDQLINQFAYGNAHQPLAVRNWAARAYAEQQDIQFVYLIGKGLEYPYVRIPIIDYSDYNLISPFGFFGSDNLLLSPIGQSRPYFPTGRLAARNAGEVLFYLDKVKRYESDFEVAHTLQRHSWRKKGIHLVGGGKQSELDYHQSLLSYIEEEVTNDPLGMDIETLVGKSTDPVSSSSVEYLIDKINEGILMKTYLGHGGVSTTGNFTIDDASLLSNKDHFPIVFSLGCLTGNIFSPQFSISEVFTLAPERGAICYMGSSGLGFPSSLTAFTHEFYRLSSTSLYGRGVGTIMQAVREKFDKDSNYTIASLVDQFSLHGDPAIVIAKDSLPDLLLDYSSLLTTPSPVRTNTDSIRFQCVIWNLGRTIPLSVPVHVTIETPDAQFIHIYDTTQVLSSRTTYTFYLPTGGSLMAGSYKLFLTLDEDNVIAESPNGGNDNNSLRSKDNNPFWPFQVLENAVLPLWPNEFAIVHRDSLVLSVFSPGDVSNQTITVVELDTVSTFDSPALISWEDDSPSLIKTFATKEVLSFGIYFWRTGRKTITPSSDPVVWNASSFLLDSVLTEGWNQSHGEQFHRNDLTQISPLKGDTTWLFNTKFVNAGARAAVNSDFNSVGITFNLNNAVTYLGVSSPSLNIMVVNPITGVKREVKSFLLSGANQKRKEAIDYLRDQITSGDYAICATFRKQGVNYSLDEWTQDSVLYGDNLYSILEKQGATQVRGLIQNASGPYALAFRKDIGPIIEKVGELGEENAIIVFDIPATYPEGWMTSRFIGPAQRWDSLTTAITLLQGASNDSTTIQLLGYADTLSAPDVLLATVSAKEDLSFVNAEAYPYLQLTYYTRDDTTRLPAQLAAWRIFHLPPPEFTAEFSTGPLPARVEGDQMDIPFQLSNIGGSYSDSIPYRVIHIFPDFTADTLNAWIQGLHQSELFLSDLSLTSVGPIGLHTIRLEINPRRSINETVFADNTTQLSFLVLPDDQPPLLQILFDSIQIETGALVNERPQIDIYLWDNNKHIQLKDTAILRVRLFDPGGHMVPLSYQQGDLHFEPAYMGALNQVKVSFTPFLSEDGFYTLDVQAYDANGKPYSSAYYEVKFHVDRSYSFAGFTAFPNPSNGDIGFRYSYTGPRAPSRASLCIYSTNGQLVRQFGQSEIGTILPGTHTTSLRWDGRDRAGHPVPSGAYYYVIDLFGENNKPIPGSGQTGTLIRLAP